jgi:hypothetical protein
MEAALSPLQRGRCLETREGYAANSLCANCKEFLQRRCVSHLNLIMGCVVGKSTVSEWGCLRLHTAVEPPFNVLFQWPQVNTLSAKFPPFKTIGTLLSIYTSLKQGFHSHQICTYLNFVVGSPDV